MKKTLLASFAFSSLLASEPIVLDSNNNFNVKNDSIYSIQLISYNKTRENLAHKFFLNLDDDIRKDAVMYQNNDYIYIRYKTSLDKKNLSKELAELKKGQYKDSYIVKSNYKSLLKAKKNNELQFGIIPPEEMKPKKTLLLGDGYSIQLITLSKTNLKRTKKLFNNLPKYVQERSVIYPVGKFLTIRYFIKKSSAELKNDLKDIKNHGFKDAFIIKTSLDKFNDIRSKMGLDANNVSNTKHNIRDVKNSEKQFEMLKLSTFEYSKTLIDAHEMKNKNKLRASIKLYEKALGHDQTNLFVNNNLYYLYGRTNNWPRANQLINIIDNKDKVLYAYSIGAIEINNPNLERELLEVLKYDISGYTKLALGSFFENNKSYKKSHDYYKKAYDNNRYDLYLAFAYARSCEINNDTKNAKFVYKMISNNTDDNLHNFKKQAYIRYNQLNRLEQIENKE